MGADFLNAFSRFQSARQGQLANYDAMRMATAERLFQISQDPAARAFLAQHPEQGRILGLTGAPIQEPTSERVDANTVRMQVPEALFQRPGLTPGMPSDTPAMVMTPDRAQTEQRLADAGWQKTLSALAQRGGVGDMVLKGIKPSGPEFGYPDPMQVPEGARGPENKPITGGQRVGTKTMIVQPEKPTPGAQALRGQIARLDAASSSIKALYMKPGPDGTLMLDPDIATVARQLMIPGATSGGLVGTTSAGVGRVLGKLGVQDDRLTALIRDSSTPPNIRNAAQRLASRDSQLANLVKSFGDVGAIAEGEQSRMALLLPTGGDTPEQMNEKVLTILAVQDELRNKLATTSMTKGEVRAFLNSRFGLDLQGASPEQDMEPANPEMIGGDGTEASAPAASPFALTDKKRAELDKKFGFGGTP